MTKLQFDHFCNAIDDLIGKPQMTWEGPLPHDFRKMKERGVRFVHSGLMARLPSQMIRFGEDIDWAPLNIVEFRILVGDDAAAAMIGQRITDAGFTWQHDDIGSEFYGAIIFEVPVDAS